MTKKAYTYEYYGYDSNLKEIVFASGKYKTFNAALRRMFKVSDEVLGKGWKQNPAFNPTLADLDWYAVNELGETVSMRIII